MENAHLPIQSTTHQKEDKSRNKFNEVISPWLVRQWFEHDYGIDAGVEITLPILNSKDRLVSGKNFSVQLKSSEKAKKNSESKIKSISIPVPKINYWHSSNLPTMLCYYDENEKEFFYKWIDDNLITQLNNKNPKWVGQKTVTIKLKNKISENLDDIKEYVYNWKRSNSSVLTAGSYFHFNDEIIKLIDSIYALSLEHKNTYLPPILKELKLNLSKAIYSISIAGQSRAGKSTLINALVGKEVSPVGVFPTTGVPICILPGVKEECEILFQDNTVKKGKVNVKFISQFADQKQNKGNKKKVKLILAKIIDQSFEKGIALYDIPGLNDPNVGIRNLSNTAVINSNAIIYVISAAPMAMSEFILGKEILDDLNALRNSSEKIFIVVNKADYLDEKLLLELKKYLKSQFKEYGVNKFHPSPPIFMSAISDSNDSSSYSNIESLKNTLWDFLLKQKKTGLHRLFSGLNKANQALNETITISKSRLLSIEKRNKVQNDIIDINSDLEILHSKILKYKEEIFEKLQNTIQINKNRITNHLWNELTNIPSNQPLFTKKIIDNYLLSESEKLSLNVQHDFADSLIKVENEINNWIKEKLKQVQLEITSNSSFLNSNNNHYSWLIHNQLGGDTSKNFFQFLLDAIIGTINTVMDAGETLIKGKEEMRIKRIQNIHKSSVNVLNRIFTSITQQIKIQFDNIADEILKNTYERTRIYLDNLEQQLKMTETPLSKIELKKLNIYLKKLEEFQSEIRSLELQIQEKIQHND